MRVLRMYIRSHFYLKCDSIIAKCIGGCVYIHTSTYYVKKPQMIFLLQRRSVHGQIWKTPGTNAYN